ncbi:MAG TPA: HNH endonuclease, partial [Acidimicrobiia bacterium]|nr:HNH endonuclease [Acidimicrobiia bacterium]
DAGCRFVGCPHKGWVHGHHITHWADGGPTNLENLVLFCGFHHRFLHEHGWTIEGDPGGKLVFRKPNGRIYPPARSEVDPQLRELVRT